ncbi:hypothetical protein [Sphingomonas sp. dw_22]|uniref:hypothetical protein n=1 Tax=Sphingomonas sp. dw_22 TaxID=2721175 RepID=UPI001BD2C141|nr:hypothetical protein [Sphingomonas sp. dw_22]
MRFMLLAAVVASLSSAPASLAQEAPQGPQMTVADFIDRWTAVKAEKDKPEQAAQAARLTYALGESFKRYKAELDADAKAGKPPRACPTKGTKDTFQIDDLVNALDDLPQVRREGAFDTEFFEFLDRRYPCTAPVSPSSPSAPAAAGTAPG